MRDKPDATRERLPITAEVGDEGGSFADPTYQESSKRGPRGPGLPRVEEMPQPVHPDDRRGDPDAGMKKYPTEEP